MRRKGTAGAHVVVTTPTLDPAALAGFLDRVGDLDVSVLAGLTLLPAAGVMEYLLEEVPTFHVPDGIRDRIRGAGTAQEAEQLGIQAALDVAREVRERVAGFQIVPLFGKVENLGTLVRALRAALASD